MSTSGIVSNTELAVQVAFGKRVGTATINEFDDAVAGARRAPRRGPGAPGAGKPGVHAGDRQADLQAEPDLQRVHRGDHAGIPRRRSPPTRSSPCKAEKLIAAGFLDDGQSFVAFANSKGNFGYQQRTNVDYTCTVRTEDGRGSGWVGAQRRATSASSTPTSDIRIAMRKATRSAEAKALEPGKYTVILEPAAAAGLICS